MVSTHDPGKTFNVDICGGYPSLVMKMLAYAEPGLVSLLPCTPREWSEGSLKGTALRGGIVINDLSWSGENVTATLLVSRIDQTVKVELRGQYVEDIELKAGYAADHFFLIFVYERGGCFAKHPPFLL